MIETLLASTANYRVVGWLKVDLKLCLFWTRGRRRGARRLLVVMSLWRKGTGWFKAFHCELCQRNGKVWKQSKEVRVNDEWSRSKVELSYKGLWEQHEEAVQNEIEELREEAWTWGSPERLFTTGAGSANCPVYIHDYDYSGMFFGRASREETMSPSLRVSRKPFHYWRRDRKLSSLHTRYDYLVLRPRTLRMQTWQKWLLGILQASCPTYLKSM
jgi:hypothetical protein